MVDDVTPAEVAAALSGEEPPILLDVREPDELAVASVPGALHIPMGSIPTRLQELSPDRRIAVLCHSGLRSAQVAMFLEAQGYDDVANVEGGIDRWSVEVDPTIPRY